MRFATIAATLVFVLGLSAPAFAGDGNRERAKERVKERLQNLTPEQKERLKERMKERLQNLTPEQKEALKERLRARRAQGK